MTWTHGRHCDAAEAEITAFADTVREADPQAPVPTCPGWSLADLTRHLGTVHRWAAGLIATAATERRSARRLGVVPPEEPADLPSWYEEGGGLLLETLRSHHPDEPVWAWGPDQHVRWWSRRMLHETLVHRCDADLALGRTPVIADPDTAVNGVGELLTNMPSAAAFSPKISELRGDGATLAFAATDAGVRWDLRLRPDGFGWSQGGAAPAEPSAELAVTVRGTAADLYLFLWRRRALGDLGLQVSGDEALLARWVENSAIG